MASNHRAVLPNGLRVLYRRQEGSPLSAGTLLIPGGSSQESASEAGLSNLTSELLLQGTRGRNAQRLARDLESIGTFMGAQTSEDYAEAGFVAPAAEVREALDIFAEV